MSGTIVLDDGRQRIDRAGLEHEIGALASVLVVQRSRVLATLLDNSPAWVCADLAAARAGVVHVPLPLFFTPDQVAHALHSAGVDTVLAEVQLAARWTQIPRQRYRIAGRDLVLLHLPAVPVAMPVGTAKVTFTSGTTGTPKGVCLSSEAMQLVTTGLVQALAPLGVGRHLSALPFAVLLENIAGLMAPLAHGATCIVPPLAELGLSGSSSFDAARFDAAVTAHRPHSIILLPRMLRAWVGYLMQTGRQAPQGLRIVAVGGAAVGAKVISAAQALGIPACEGYGLSEGASVQTLNLPGAQCAGSAGRPLPHARVRISADGEVEVAGSLFSGYLGEATRPLAPDAWWPTGDLGEIDADGYLHLRGRRKHVLITAFGRNVSPEWVETALRGEAAIAQAVVFGDGEPALSAVLWPIRADLGDSALQAAVNAANASLPDYARVQHWVRGRSAFDAASGLATANGRPRRDSILAAHADVLLTATTPTEPLTTP
jgi:long-chain acyl-CoA synthetase